VQKTGCVMGVSRDEVTWCYRTILGREPESEGAIIEHMKNPDFASLRDFFLNSGEFSSSRYANNKSFFVGKWVKHHPVKLSIIEDGLDQQSIEFVMSDKELEDIEALKIIFIHIPKTGGTTLHEELVPFFEPDRICPERFNGLSKYRSAILAEYRFFSGHFELGSCALIPGPKQIITILRHPVDRLVSIYNFLRVHRDEHPDPFVSLARRYNITEFFSLEEVRNHSSINNTMVRVLSADLLNPFSGVMDDDATSLLVRAKEKLGSSLVFGILERYEESVKWIFHSIGLQAPSVITPKNVTKDLIDRNFLEKRKPQICDQKTLELIRSLVEADLELYNYGVKLFENNINSLVPLAAEGKGWSKVFRYQKCGLRNKVGNLFDYGCVTDGREGFLAYGPYIRLRPGVYCAELLLNTDLPFSGEALIDVVVNYGNNCITKKRVFFEESCMNEPFTINFEADFFMRDLEVRVFCLKDTQLFLEGIRICEVVR